MGFGVWGLFRSSYAVSVGTVVVVFVVQGGGTFYTTRKDLHWSLCIGIGFAELLSLGIVGES